MGRVLTMIVLLLVTCAVFIFLYSVRDNGESIEAVGKDSALFGERDEAALKSTLTPDNDVSTISGYGNLQTLPSAKNGLPLEVFESQEVKTGLKRIKKSVKQKSLSKLETKDSESDNFVSDVPESYPLEDAELYFVPPEDRFPGNLGGPPPLNLPNPEIEPN